MAIDGFDYKAFAYDLSKQLKDIIPKELNKEQQQYLVETFNNFALTCGETIYNDEGLKFDCNQATLITQIVAEWTYHKIIDLCHSDIPRKYWDEIIQKIAFTAFVITKESLIKNIEQEQITQVVEYHVIKTWKKCINQLQDKSVLSEKSAEHAKTLSNIDDIAKRTNEQKFVKNEEMYKLEKIYNCFDNEKIYCNKGVSPSDPENKKKSSQLLYILPFIVISITKFCLVCCVIYTLFLLSAYFTFMHSLILIIMDIIFHHKLLLNIMFICIFVLTIFYSTKRLTEKDIAKKLKLLEDTKQKMQELVDTDKMYERLNTDEIKITVGDRLIQITDPYQEGELLAKIFALRQQLVDDLGYIVPQVRVTNNPELEDFEYKILIRDIPVGSGFIYPNKYMVESEDWNKLNKKVPASATIAVNPVLKTQVYWIDSDDFYDDSVYTIKTKIKKSEEVIILHLKELLIKHADKILTISHILMLINYVNKRNPKFFEDIKENGITEYDLQKIFINLIKENISIKDIIYLFERIADLSRTFKNTDNISEKIRTIILNN